MTWTRRGSCERGATWWFPNRRLRKNLCRLLKGSAVSRRMLQKDEGVVSRVPAGGVGGGCGGGGEGKGCGDGSVVGGGGEGGDGRSGRDAGRDTVSQN